MTRWAAKQFTGWGRVSTVDSLAARPERLSDVARALADAGNATLLAFGSGRSYGDAALNSHGRTIVTRRLDRFLGFDATTGLLTAEPGVTFGEIIDTFLPLGFTAPVVPGTGFATLGGGVANDVHGKNHHQVGSLGQHLEWFDLRLPHGELRRVDAQNEPLLFRATLGGLGLTGIIERICMRLKPVTSNAVRVRKRRIRDLDQFIEEFEREKSGAHYVVGWIDALAKGAAMGRGILEVASPAEQSLVRSVRKARRVPFDLPGFALNPVSVKAFNWFYGRHVSSTGIERVQPYHEFLFPLDALHDWNRIYGKRGFRQFQCVVPFEAGREALLKILEKISTAGRGSFLAVLKAMGPAGLGCLSFPMPGYTLALDFPNGAGVTEFMAGLEKIVCDYGGRIYLAKDSTLSADRFMRMYPQAGEFVEALKQIDPMRRMQSDLSVRLGLGAAPHG